MECSVAFNLGYVIVTKLKLVRNIFYLVFYTDVGPKAGIKYRLAAFETTY